MLLSYIYHAVTDLLNEWGNKSMERRWKYQLIKLIREDPRQWHIKSVLLHSKYYPVICDHSMNFKGSPSNERYEEELDRIPIGELCEKCLEKIQYELDELQKELNDYKRKLM